jgi:hypothetical protein
MNKYRNVKFRGFDSKKEARRYEELKILEREGSIRSLRTQVKYELIPSQRGKDGKVIERACCYVADFTYIDTDTGMLVVEDTKGYTRKNPEYIIKRKLMLQKYGIRILES